MARGGKRPGAGRKPQGITKKVSITLTAEEWRVIEESGTTVAAFIKSLIHRNRLLKSERERRIEEYKQYLSTVTRDVVLEGVVKGSYHRRPYAVPYKMVFISDLGPIIEISNLDQDDPLYKIIFKRLIRKHRDMWDELTERARINRSARSTT